MKLPNILKIAFASKKASLGFQAVITNIYSKKAKLVVLATNAGPTTSEKVLKAAEKQQIQVIQNYTKSELGKIVKGHGEIAVVSINDHNLSKIKGVKWAKLK